MLREEDDGGAVRLVPVRILGKILGTRGRPDEIIYRRLDTPGGLPLIANPGEIRMLEAEEFENWREGQAASD